jgi:hypothetical protein
MVPSTQRVNKDYNSEGYSRITTQRVVDMGIKWDKDAISIEKRDTRHKRQGEAFLFPVAPSHVIPFPFVLASSPSLLSGPKPSK